jgi:hypothetical protein
MKRLQVEFPEEKLIELEQLMSTIGVPTKRQLVIESLTCYEWAIRECQAGRTIVSMDGLGACRELVMPSLGLAEGGSRASHATTAESDRRSSGETASNSLTAPALSHSTGNTELILARQASIASQCEPAELPAQPVPSRNGAGFSDFDEFVIETPAEVMRSASAGMPPDHDPEVRDRIDRVVARMCATDEPREVEGLKDELGRALFGGFARYEHPCWGELYEWVRQGHVSADDLTKFHHWKRLSAVPAGDWYKTFTSFTVCGNGSAWTGLIFDGTSPSGRPID